MKKKLLIATDSFLPRWDGIARFLHEILPHLSQDYNITVIAPAYKGNFTEYPDVRVIRFTVSKTWLGDYKPSWPKYGMIKNEIKNADIVWTQTIGPIGGATIIEAKRQKKPLLAFIHSIEWDLFTKSMNMKEPLNTLIYSFTKSMARFLYNKCTFLLVPSKEVGELFRLEKIKTQKKVIPLGVNLDFFRPPESKEKAKQAIGLSPSQFVIGFSGRIGREKDLMTLYRAFLRVRMKHHNAALLLVGTGVEDIEKRLDRKKGVVLVGSTDNVLSYLQAMDVYVLPSLTETSSLSTMEAMACGVPVICTPVGSIKDYVKPNVNGYLFPKRHTYALTKLLESMITDEKKLEEMGRRARKTAIANFSWDRTVKELREVFDLF